MKDIKNKKNKAGVLSKNFKVIAFVLGIAFALVWSMAGPYPSVVDDEHGWRVVWDGNFASAAEGDPGAGASGIVWIGFVNHSASHNYPNASGTIEGWCDANNLGYASADDFNVEIAHDCDFDIVIKVRVNKTHAWDGSAFVDSWVRMYINSSDLSLSSEAMEGPEIGLNDSGKDYIWLYFYVDFSDSGYDFAKDQSANIDDIKLEAYY